VDALASGVSELSLALAVYSRRMMFTDGEGEALVGSASGAGGGGGAELCRTVISVRAGGGAASTSTPAAAEPWSGVAPTVPEVIVTSGRGVGAKWPEAQDRKYPCPAALQPTNRRNSHEVRHTMTR
jgi:hypothetical protein